MQKEEVILYIEKKYKVKPQFPWAPRAEHMVFKHSKNKKWFALIMGVTGDKLGLETGYGLIGKYKDEQEYIAGLSYE